MPCPPQGKTPPGGKRYMLSTQDDSIILVIDLLAHRHTSRNAKARYQFLRILDDMLLLRYQTFDGSVFYS